MEIERQNEQTLNQIDSYAEQISRQNAIIAYNAECAANELNQLKWLETFKALS